MKRIVFASAILVLAAVYVLQPAPVQRLANEGPPPPVIVDVSSCEVPPGEGTNLPPWSAYDQLPYFDSYSWRAFAALVCDAMAGHRGQADPGWGREGTGARVFETFKSAWEVYHSGAVIKNWDHYVDQSRNPCPNAAPGDLVLASTSKWIDTDLLDDNALPTGPLPAQNGTYVHYLTQYNQVSFNYIADVLAGKIKGNIQFPERSVNIKSAWVEMTGLDKTRFYTRYAWVPRPRRACENVEVGLVGLHIVQKTHTRPYWIWSTFEQVNNAPDSGATCTGECGPYTFNKGDGRKMPDSPQPNPPYPPPTDIFNVERAWHLIGVRTRDMNAQYWKQLGTNSRWSNYELVMTNWTSQPTQPANAGSPAFTFPTAEVNSAFANTVMETFFQRDITMSCLGCHANAVDNDFAWSLKIEPKLSRTTGLQQLRRVTEEAGVSLK